MYQWIDLNTPFHGNRMDIVQGLPVAEGVALGMSRSNQLAVKYSAYRPPFGHTNPSVPQQVTERNLPDQKILRQKRNQGRVPFVAKWEKGQKDPIILDLGGGQSIKLVYERGRL